MAVLGLGRSGVSAAKALLLVGARPVVLDEASETTPKTAKHGEELEDLGVPVVLGWASPWDSDSIDLVVTSPSLPRDHPRLLEAIGEGLEVISEPELAYRITRAPIVAITGTNGKSTTTVMTWLCLREAGEDALLCGNIYGSGYEETPLSEAAASATPEQTLVAEISSFQLEWVKQFRPASAGITNVAPDHLNRYGGSFEAYAATKHRLFAQQGRSDTVAVRMGDPLVRAPSGVGSPLALTFGPGSGDANLGAERLAVLGQEIAWKDVPFQEPHNRLNAAMATLLAVGLLRRRALDDPGGRAASLLDQALSERLPAREGASEPKLAAPRSVLEGLKKFRPLQHRMERLGERDGVAIINNSMCTNPAAVVASARALSGRRHLLLGGTNKELDFIPLRAHLASTGDAAYLFGRDASSLNEMLGRRWPVYASMAESFEAACRSAKPGETIMLAPGCASMDQFEDFVERGNVFKQIAQEWLSR
ncbi:MAG: UDP-N-acetylmuramoyl-L-alanine--D-glutamate ligase [Fimbriimonas ginsengisoli]|uniref:UDP-N-acetylmuramoylalanine--D-glutamate ligase n=1 Tax=Fimbriimonas ginsengisoli TaxID=1005039 RepID=A0A931LYS8_FIMGI|nr:UDP-N-acetylmuramoyl-L-alanine--D-glutamate ligase [Fimbriimonas ginsengisoli]